MLSFLALRSARSCIHIIVHCVVLAWAPNHLYINEAVVLPGLEPTGNCVDRPANFKIDTFAGGKGDPLVLVKNPRGQPERVSFRLSSHCVIAGGVTACSMLFLLRMHGLLISNTL